MDLDEQKEISIGSVEVEEQLSKQISEHTISFDLKDDFKDDVKDDFKDDKLSESDEYIEDESLYSIED